MPGGSAGASDGVSMAIRPERASDRQAIHELNKSAFESPAEADLVEALRRQANPIISLVSEIGGEIVGHIFFSPVTLVDHPEFNIMGLGPMSVSTNRQRTGIGSKLVHAGIEGCRKLPCGAIVVLGHKDYYPRFGFLPGSQFDVNCEYDVPEGIFMILELIPGALEEIAGTVKYHNAFGNI